MKKIGEFLSELRRRKVWLFAGLYLGLAWVLLQMAMAIETTLSLPTWVDQLALVLLGLGLPVVLLLAWAQESVAEEGRAPSIDPSQTPKAGPQKRQSLIVLPFDCFEEDTALTTHADGLVEDITTLLGRVPDLSVTARNTAFAFKGQMPNVQKVGDDLNVRYALEGSLRTNDDALRITVQLIDTPTGTHLWADKWDLHPDGLISKDDLARTIAMETVNQITRAEADLMTDLPTENQEAWMVYKQARATQIFKGWNRQSHKQTTDLLRQATKLDPDFAPAQASLSLSLSIGEMMGFNPPGANAREESIACGQKALHLSPQSSEVLGYVGCAYSDLGQHRQGIPIIKKAIEINESNQQAFAALGAAKIRTHNIDEGIADLRQALKLSPNNPGSALWRTVLGSALAFLDGLDEAEDVARQAILDDPSFFPSHIALALVLCRKGDLEEASFEIGEAKRLEPEMTAESIHGFFGPEVARVLNDHSLIAPHM